MNLVELGGGSSQVIAVERLPEHKRLELGSLTFSCTIFWVLQTQEILGSPGRNLLEISGSFFFGR